MRGMRRPLVPRPKPWGVLPEMCAVAVGVPCSARTQPGRTEAQGALGCLCRGCQVTVGIQTKTVVANENKEKAGLEMQKAASGLRLVHVSRMVQNAELREATTGRPVAVPRIWAVAEPVQVPASPARDVSEVTQAQVAERQPAPKVELAFYRKYTEAMLRRYLRVSMQVGRVPSIMGREMFRGHVSHYTMTGFEDGVIFCVDVERCLVKLRSSDQHLIKRMALQGYTQEEAAPLLGITSRWCRVRYGQALDQLTEMFLAGRILEPLKCCQGVEGVEN